MKLPSFLTLSILVAISFAIACGGGDDADEPADTTSGDSSSATTAPANVSGSTKKTDIAAINVCPLLSKEDASDVARKAGLGGGLATYNVTATPEQYSAESQKIRPKAGCRFVIESSVITIEVEEADGWDLYAKDSAAKKIPDLGDEAVSVRGAAYVRVGNVMLSTGENSTTESFVTELYRKMIPGLRSQLK